MNAFEDAHERKPVVFADARLARAVYSSGRMCASVTEYATFTGIPVLELLDMLDEQIAVNNLSLEFFGGEIFVHTAPGGRDSSTLVPYNVWETIRRHHDVEQAYSVWLTARELENAGWALEYNLYNITGDPAIARHFGVSVRTIESWLVNGLPHARPSSRMVRFRISDCEEWYNQQYRMQSRPSAYRPRRIQSV